MEDHFSRFFFSKNFSRRRRSNIEESEHNEKTHKERTKQEEEVKRKSKETQLLFRDVFFFKQKQKDREYFFHKKFEKTQTNDEMFFEDHAWEKGPV